jgi:hypothetical protein
LENQFSLAIHDTARPVIYGKGGGRLNPNSRPVNVVFLVAFIALAIWAREIVQATPSSWCPEPADMGDLS